jgi:AcrR family transcriptional regulator
VAVVSSRTDTRSRIVGSAAELLAEHGPAAVTTRGVAERAGVQAPTIYRLFGDKDGLLDAVAEHVMAQQVSAKAAVVAAAEADGVDPLVDLRAGWDGQIAFGLAHPAVFRLLSDPDRVMDSAAARTGRAVLAARIHRVALAGRLRVGEQRAVELVQAAGIGVIQTLLASPPEARDAGLPDVLYEAVLRQILTDEEPSADRGGSARGDVRAAAVTLRAATAELEVLSGGEQRLLAEWLDRIVQAD